MTRSGSSIRALIKNTEKAFHWTGKRSSPVPKAQGQDRLLGRLVRHVLEVEHCKQWARWTLKSYFLKGRESILRGKGEARTETKAAGNDLMASRSWNHWLDAAELIIQMVQRSDRWVDQPVSSEKELLAAT